MTTRENMRRELQELAKLAKSMPSESARSEGRTRTSAAAPQPVTAKPARPALQRPPTPSTISVTIPPTVASVPPPAPEPAAHAKAVRKSGRGTLVAVAFVGLAVAVAGGATLGRTLARRTTTPVAAAAAVQAPIVETNPVAAPNPVQADSVPVQSLPAAPTATTKLAPAVAHQPVAAPAPARVSQPQVALTRRVSSPRPIAKPAAAPAAAPPAAPAAAPAAPHAAATMDPLEAAIRKAVAADSSK